jgi:two-component system phosphate regulon sensor histidine kinase PhoR
MTDSEDTERLKTHFISMITHELRSPLNTINGYLDLALEGIAGELNQQQREFVQRARAGSEHLSALIEDLLLIARADAGQLRLNCDLIRLPEIVANAIEELELIAKDNEISISVEIASDFPQIYADAIRMQHVLRNLIKNALRFTPPGGSVTISARVNNNPIATATAESIETNEDQQQIEVQIRDTGYGIAPEYQERIFDRFFQIPNAGRVNGQGLGLTIVKMIVELHGGRVTVESMAGAGSTFKFTLPF